MRRDKLQKRLRTLSAEIAFRKDRIEHGDPRKRNHHENVLARCEREIVRLCDRHFPRSMTP